MEQEERTMSKMRFFIFVCLPILVILCLLGIIIYTLVIYGEKPVSEIPTWAWFILNRGR
jgi:hypothetical protein